MKTDDLESRMRRLEWFHSLRALPGVWPIVRVDGRSFSRLTESMFQKPFDPQFHGFMTATASALLETLQGLYCYTESDEISILLPRQSDLFDRELEKLVSVSAGVASATFTHQFGKAVAHFDGRLCLAANGSLVVDYFRWRQADAARCALNGWCYWTLRKDGQNVGEATKALEGMSIADKNELLFQRGTNFNDVPAWQRRGTGIYWKTFEKPGTNPKTGVTVTALRRRIHVDDELPVGDDYATFIQSLVAADEAAG
jgi:tRNA(His) guanylyltransferase